jgi:hypothetical protein
MFSKERTFFALYQFSASLPQFDAMLAHYIAPN